MQVYRSSSVSQTVPYIYCQNNSVVWLNINIKTFSHFYPLTPGDQRDTTLPDTASSSQNRLITMHDVIQGKYMHNAEIDNILETDDSYNILQLLGFFQQMHFLA